MMSDKTQEKIEKILLDAYPAYNNVCNAKAKNALAALFEKEKIAFAERFLDIEPAYYRRDFEKDFDYEYYKQGWDELKASIKIDTENIRRKGKLQWKL